MPKPHDLVPKIKIPPMTDDEFVRLEQTIEGRNPLAISWLIATIAFQNNVTKFSGQAQRYKAHEILFDRWFKARKLQTPIPAEKFLSIAENFNAVLSEQQETERTTDLITQIKTSDITLRAGQHIESLSLSQIASFTVFCENALNEDDDPALRQAAKFMIRPIINGTIGSGFQLLAYDIATDFHVFQTAFENRFNRPMNKDELESIAQDYKVFSLQSLYQSRALLHFRSKQIREAPEHTIKLTYDQHNRLRLSFSFSDDFVSKTPTLDADRAKQYGRCPASAAQETDQSGKQVSLVERMFDFYMAEYIAAIEKFRATAEPVPQEPQSP